jgi:SAM-dependent methyltransferase
VADKGKTRVRPADYHRWRGGTLGAITERIEIDLVLDMAGGICGRQVLDVGCGDGMLAASAAGRGAHVNGVDTSLEMLEAARERASLLGPAIRLDRADAEALPFPDASFDVVFAVTVLCFVSDPEAAVREMARVLVPGGRLVLGELGRFSPWAAWRRLRGLCGNRTWRGARFWTIRELEDLVRGGGLKLEVVRGAIYYPPFGLAARLFAPVDHVPRAATTFGAAFLAVAASKPAPAGC